MIISSRYLLSLIFLFLAPVLSAQVNLTNGLVAYYPFLGNANDASGNGHAGTLVNGPVLTADRFGNPNSAYLFDGIDDYIRVNDDGAFSTGNISISLWFKTNSDALQNLIGKRKFNDDGTQAGGAQYQFFINYSPFPGIGSNLVGNNNSCATVSSSSYINTGNIICKSRWYHAVITFDGTTHKIYIDGVLKLSSNTGFNAMLNCPSELRFGVWWAGGTLPFSGIMDDIRWYNRPLNQAEVTALFNNFPQSSSTDFSYTQNACSPKAIQFNNLTPNTTSVYWNFGNGNINTTSQTPAITYAAYGNYSVKLRVQTSSGCVDSVTKIIPVNVISDSLISTADTTICKGTPIQLNTLPGLDYCWGNAPGLSSTSISNPVAVPTTNMTYYVVSQATGPNLVANGDFSAGNTGFQSDYAAIFPNNTDAQYWITSNPSTWNGGFAPCVDHTNGAGNMMLVNGSTIINSKVWQQTITVTPNTNYAFSTWVSSLFSINPANLRFSINGNLLGNNVQASSTTCLWSRFFATWNSGNNTTAVITIVNNNNAFQGNDFALDDISFSQVILKQDSIKITVTDPPALTITPDAAICAGDTLGINVSGAAIYSWSPSAGLSNAGISNPLASPAATTKYIVSAYTLPGCVSKDSVTVTVKPKPVITKSGDTSLCQGSAPVTISAVSPGAMQYAWSPAAGLSSTSVSNPLANPSSTRTFYVQVTGSNGCKQNDSIKVSVLPVPTVDTRADTTLCNGIPVTLTTTATGATSFSWTPSTGLSSPAVPNPVATPATTTKYLINASNGSCSSRDSVTITVLPAPVVNKSNDTTICNLGQAQLFASGGTAYSWSPATGLNNAGIANPVATPSAPMRYYVTVTGANGCNRTDSISVGWVPKPVFTLSPLSPSVCMGDSTLLTAGGADTYHWFAGASVASPYSAVTFVRPASTQQYAVAVRHNFCKLNDTLRATVTVNNLPVVTVKKSNDIDCSNASATLTATGGVIYRWTPAINIAAPNTATPVVSPTASTTYRVSVTDNNGCTRQDSVSVLVAFNPAMAGYYVADAFTPNSDGKNDCFGLKYWGGVQELDFSVYNQWGECVFRTGNVSACWDGTYKGIPQASGTFVYMIRAKTACGDIFKKGTVVLLR